MNCVLLSSNVKIVQYGIVWEVVFSNMKAYLIYLIMEISQTKLFVQFISGIFSALFYFQLPNHISSGLSRVALVPRYLLIIELKKKQQSHHLFLDGYSLGMGTFNKEII